MAYAAQQRTREIGLRIALGATPQQATAPMLRSGLTLAAVGTLLGLAGSVAGARTLSTMLFGVGVNDPATFIVSVPLLLVCRGRVLPAGAPGVASRSAQGDQRGRVIKGDRLTSLARWVRARRHDPVWNLTAKRGSRRDLCPELPGPRRERRQPLDLQVGARAEQIDPRPAGARRSRSCGGPNRDDGHRSR